ncbi:hypothetical protein [Paracoccus sediminicola]|uniref:hypothetical protein n=1 Tax=Paracoccus sediminicola TaxID=3017783 RepID=UPI0022F09587|nr:hypothetical protein [Paracoccus sediminicola]WBU57985.1 hypothetical protein PAF18_06050 [Paracoccus sediminicola]
MRNAAIFMACALGLSGCIEGSRTLDDPKYELEGGTPYGEYLLAREAALTGEGPVPQVIPRARPFKAPTAEEIAGPTFWQIVERDTAKLTARTTASVTGRPAYVETSEGQPDILARPARGRVVIGGGGGGYYYDPETGQRLDSSSVEVRPATPQAARATQTDALTRYALTQRHAPGTAAFTRDGGSAATAARACARMPNPEAAQLMFLTAGGPQADPYGMDPDGDGFVCGWDPAPYRIARL